MSLPQRIPAALRLSGLHFAGSLLVVASLVLGLLWLWYPEPYRSILGGQRLIWLLLAVDVVCGPLLTLVTYSPAKSRREWRLDFSIILLLQSLALAFGLYTMAQARPVLLGFEVDRFVLVSASELRDANLSLAPAGLRKLSWSGPRLICTRNAKDGEERLASIDLSLAGVSPVLRPDWWRPWPSCRNQVIARMRPLAELQAKRPEAAAELSAAITRSGLRGEGNHYLPLTSARGDFWVLLLDAQAQPTGHAHVDGF